MPIDARTAKLLEDIDAYVDKPGEMRVNLAVLFSGLSTSTTTVKRDLEASKKKYIAYQTAVSAIQRDIADKISAVNDEEDRIRSSTLASQEEALAKLDAAKSSLDKLAKSLALDIKRQQAYIAMQRGFFPMPNVNIHFQFLNDLKLVIDPKADISTLEQRLLDLRAACKNINELNTRLKKIQQIIRTMYEKADYLSSYGERNMSYHMEKYAIQKRRIFYSYNSLLDAVEEKIATAVAEGKPEGDSELKRLREIREEVRSTKTKDLSLWHQEVVADMTDAEKKVDTYFKLTAFIQYDILTQPSDNLRTLRIEDWIDTMREYQKNGPYALAVCISTALHSEAIQALSASLNAITGERLSLLTSIPSEMLSQQDIERRSSAVQQESKLAVSALLTFPDNLNNELRRLIGPIKAPETTSDMSSTSASQRLNRYVRKIGLTGFSKRNVTPADTAIDTHAPAPISVRVASPSTSATRTAAVTANTVNSPQGELPPAETRPASPSSSLPEPPAALPPSSENVSAADTVALPTPLLSAADSTAEISVLSPTSELAVSVSKNKPSAEAAEGVKRFLPLVPGSNEFRSIQRELDKTYASQVARFLESTTSARAGKLDLHIDTIQNTTLGMEIQLLRYQKALEKNNLPQPPLVEALQNDIRAIQANIAEIESIPAEERRIPYYSKSEKEAEIVTDQQAAMQKVNAFLNLNQRSSDSPPPTSAMALDSDLEVPAIRGTEKGGRESIRCIYHETNVPTTKNEAATARSVIVQSQHAGRLKSELYLQENPALTTQADSFSQTMSKRVFGGVSMPRDHVIIEAMSFVDNHLKSYEGKRDPNTQLPLDRDNNPMRFHIQVNTASTEVVEAIMLTFKHRGLPAPTIDPSDKQFKITSAQEKAFASKMNSPLFEDVLTREQRVGLKQAKKEMEAVQPSPTARMDDTRFENRGMPKAAQIKDGDELRNVNSYDYLTHIAEVMPSYLAEKSDVFKRVMDLCGKDTLYDPKVAYGDLYTKFLLELEDKINDIEINPYASEMIHRIYANPNKALERSEEMVTEVIKLASHTSSEIQGVVRRRLKGNSNTNLGKFLDHANYHLKFRNLNVTTPQAEGSLIGRLRATASTIDRLRAITGQTFKPQTITSLASERTYEYTRHDNSRPKEYRFGTQGQFHLGGARVSPLFEAWLRVQEERRRATGKTNAITHIYFNNLGRDRTNFEGKKEKELTEELEKLEARHSNVAVITLPADKGIMNRRMLKHHQKEITHDEAMQRMMRIATNDDQEAIKDFYISEKVKKIIYTQKTATGESVYNENGILEDLLKKSFQTLGFEDKQNMSEAQVQAVFFHFIKYELTNHILDTIKPDSFNISCKDAIDRGGVHSAYFNLMRSIEDEPMSEEQRKHVYAEVLQLMFEELGKPMSEKEFDRALHAAPTLVKGRGMNHHSQLIWNAIDTFIDAQDKKKIKVEDWLRNWRDNNAPPYSIRYHIIQLEEYINKRTAENGHELSSSSLFGHSRGISPGLEKKTAETLRDVIEGKADISGFSPEQKRTLYTGELGKIRSRIEKNGIIPPGKFKLLEETHAESLKKS